MILTRSLVNDAKLPKETKVLAVTRELSFHLVTNYPPGNYLMVARRKSQVPAPPEPCDLSECLGVIGGAWTPKIIWYLSMGPRTFSELKSDVHGISAKVLTTRLRSLQSAGVVLREVKPTSPPTVEYSLSALGAELQPAIEAIAKVGHRLKELKKDIPEGLRNK